MGLGLASRGKNSSEWLEALDRGSCSRQNSQVARIGIYLTLIFSNMHRLELLAPIDMKRPFKSNASNNGGQNSISVPSVKPLTIGHEVERHVCACREALSKSNIIGIIIVHQLTTQI